MKEKISISMDEEMLKKVDSLIDDVSIMNRSQAIEYLVRISLEKKGIHKAVILAGGEKEKLRFGKTFKPLVKIDNEEVVKHTVKLLKRYGINEIIIFAGHLNNEIFNILGDGYELGVRIIYMKDKNVGTAGVLKQSQRYLQNDFFVILGDIYFDFDLEKMITFHYSHNKLVTLAVSTTKLKESKDRLELEGNRVVRFDYVPETRTFMVNAGIYILRPGIFNFLPDKGSMEKAVFPKLAQSGNIVAYNFSGNWKHIGYS